MKKTLQMVASIGISAALLATSTGCSAFRSSMQTMSVSCSPPDAVLMVNGQRYDPPAQVSVKRNRDVALQCYKEGFVPYQRTVGNHFNDTGILDAVGTFLFTLPGIGLLTPGAWSLDETDVTITLFQK